MKREDVTKVFENATKEQIDAILDLNSGTSRPHKILCKSETQKYTLKLPKTKRFRQLLHITK